MRQYNVFAISETGASIEHANYHTASAADAATAFAEDYDIRDGKLLAVTGVQDHGAPFVRLFTVRRDKVTVRPGYDA